MPRTSLALAFVLLIIGCTDDRARDDADTGDVQVGDADTSDVQVGDADTGESLDVEAPDASGDSGSDVEVTDPTVHVLDLGPTDPPFASARLASNGQRVYLGRFLSDSPARDNLWVLDPRRAPVVGDAVVARIAFDAEPLPPGQRDTVSALALHPAGDRLYAALAPLDGAGSSVLGPMRDLYVFALDDAGRPTTSSAVDSGQLYHTIESLLVAPDGRWLFAAGFGEEAVRAFPLDAAGDFAGPPTVVRFGGVGKHWLGLAPAGAIAATDPAVGHLLAGTYPGSLEVLPLDASGLPVSPSPEPPSALCWSACDPSEGYLSLTLATLAGETPPSRGAAEEARAPLVALRVADQDRPPYELAAHPSGPLALLDLSRAESRPVDLVDTRATAVAARTTGTDRLDAAGADRTVRNLVWARETVFADAATGLLAPDGAELVTATLRAHSDGAPTIEDAVVVARAPGRRITRVLIADGAPDLVALAEPLPIAAGLSRAFDLTLTVDVLDADDLDGAPVDAATLELHLAAVHGRPDEIPALTVGTPYPLEPYVRGLDGAILAQIATYTPLSRLHLRATFRAEGAVVHSFESDVVGSEVLFFLPGGRVDPSARHALLESFDARAERYRDTARAAAPEAGPRPERFTVSCFHLLGGQGSRPELAALTETIARLGCNTVTAYAWGRLPTAEVRQALLDHAIPGATTAVYMPPSYFAFDAELFTDEALDHFIDTTFEADLTATGRTWDELRNLQVADEPGWYYPMETDRIAADPALLARFQGWLEAQGLPPEDYGATSFEDVLPATGEARGTVQANRLYAATMRFFPEQAAQAIGRLRERLEVRAGRRLFVSSNFNNSGIAAWPTPDTPFANNPDTTARAGYGSLDWFDYARAGAANPWTEDWFPDRAALDWTLPAAMLRHMSELSGRPFGAYIIGGMMGLTPGGPSLKLFALLGRGLALLDVWTFGPEPLFPGNCWSDNFAAYGEIAAALGRLGRLEDAIIGARPANGQVGFLLPTASLLWDTSYSSHRSFLLEPGFTAPAFAAANLDLDPLDEVDVAGGALTERGLTVLYAFGPNIAQSAQEAIARWVEGGGTLVLLPSAGVADALAQPTARFDGLAGVDAPRPEERPGPNPWGFGKNPLTTALRVTAEGRALGLGDLALVGPVQGLVPGSAAVVLATDADGRALAMRHPVGRGQVVTLGFWPGMELLQRRASERYDRLLPLGEAASRAWATLGAQVAGVAKEVQVSVDGVEALVLTRDDTTTVLLLNWTGAPLPSVTVTLSSPHTTLTTLEAAAPESTRNGDAWQVTLPLRDVEALVFTE